MKTLFESYHIPPEIIHVTGIPVRRAFYEKVAEGKPFEKGTVLVMGGGLGLGNVIDNITRPMK